MELVDLFSDLVLEKALENIQFLEHITAQNISLFWCREDEIVLIGVSSDNNEVDFTVEGFIESEMGVKIFKTTNPYNEDRESDVFNLLQSGCSIIDEDRFRKFELAHNYSTDQSKN